MKSSQFYALGFLTLVLSFCFIALMNAKMSDTVFSSILFILIPTGVGLFGLDNYNKRKVEEKVVENGQQPRGLL